VNKMNQVYRKDEFIITPFYKGKRQEFMVVNTKKEFKSGHTHLKSFKMAKYLIGLVRSKQINCGLRPYFLTSLTRISNDEEYNRKVNEVLSEKRRKGKKLSYRNEGGRKS
jgi:hypothetical protein